MRLRDVLGCLSAQKGKSQKKISSHATVQNTHNSIWQDAAGIAEQDGVGGTCIHQLFKCHGGHMFAHVYCEMPGHPQGQHPAESP